MNTLKYILRNEWYNLIFLALPFVAIPFLYSHLPNEVPLHWSLDGRAGLQSGDKWLGLMLIPLINVVLYFTLLAEARLKDKRPKTLRTSVVLSFLYISGVNLTVNLGVDIAPINFLLPLAAVILFFTGNYFRMHDPGDLIGIHLPWSYDDPNKWHKSHQFAVYVWMAAGLWMMILLFLGNTRIKIDLFFSTILVVALLPTAYSFYQYNLKY